MRPTGRGRRRIKNFGNREWDSGTGNPETLELELVTEIVIFHKNRDFNNPFYPENEKVRKDMDFIGNLTVFIAANAF